MSKRKKRGSISDLWDRVAGTVSSLDSRKISKKDFEKELASVAVEANRSGVSSLIAENLVKPYLQSKKEVKVEFVGSATAGEDGGVELAGDGEDVRINPVGIYRFHSLITASKGLDTVSGDFDEARRLCFHKELGKLPGPYFIFIAVLCKLAMTNQIFTAEKRGGKKITPGGLSVASYFPLLWALKQFEAFYKRIQNRDMRSDFGIIWHEGEWVEKNKHQEARK